MRNFLIAFNVFLITSIVVLLYGNLRVPPEIAHRIIIILSLFIIIAVNGLWLKQFKKIFAKWGKWTLLFISNLVIQLTVLYTGGLYSPFIIFFHFFTLGISFIFSFPIALTFLVFSLINLLIATIVDPYMMNLVLENPTMLVIYVVSFIVFVPIAQILSHQYHIRDKLFELLKYQVEVEGSILKNVTDLVFLLDQDFNILSLNDAAEQAIQKNRVEALNRNIFDVLFLKNKDGKLITLSELSISEIVDNKKPQELSDLLLISTNAPVRKVHASIKPIVGPSGEIDHISFIISDLTATAKKTGTDGKSLEEAELKLSALIQDLTVRAQKKGLDDISTRLLLINKIQGDIQSYYSIERHGISSKKSYVDIASLCRQLVTENKKYSQLFSVSLGYDLDNEKINNLVPLIANALKISPENTTGPFFSVRTNVKYLTLLIQKIIDLSILIASNSTSPDIKVSVGHESDNMITIKIASSSFSLSEQQQSDLFVKYYGSLRDVGNFHLGSGLEGEMIKTVSGYLDIELKTEYKPDFNQYEFLLRINKDTNTFNSTLNSLKPNTQDIDK